MVHSFLKYRYLDDSAGFERFSDSEMDRESRGRVYIVGAMENCESYPKLKRGAKAASTGGADFEDVMPIVWRVMEKYPEARQELQEEICAAMRKVAAAIEQRRGS